MDLTNARWRKSSFSAHEDCVEVAITDEVVAVRHSRRPSGSVLFFTPGEWRAFLAGAQAGEFDPAK